MWHVNVIPKKVAYGLQVKECVCPKRETIVELNKMEFWKGIWGYEACIQARSTRKSGVQWTQPPDDTVTQEYRQGAKQDPN
jgi:hypothetical protein